MGTSGYLDFNLVNSYKVGVRESVCVVVGEPCNPVENRDPIERHNELHQ